MKKVFVGFLTVLLVGIMVGCSSVAPLPNSISKEAATTKCEEVISLVNSKNYAAIIAMGRADFQAQISEDAIAQAFNEILDKAGAFVEITKVTTGGTKDESGNELAVALVECKYQNAKHTYTISFDTAMALTGIFIK